MINYEIAPKVVALFVPSGTELDSWNGKTFISLVGFLFLQTRVVGVPIPLHGNFEEINLRFYVRRRGPEGWRRGVVFIKEIVPRRMIAAIARLVYNENYVACPMGSSIQLPTERKVGHVEYRWQVRASSHALKAEFGGIACYPEMGSEEEFITEHYWGYSSQRDGSTLEYQVEHPQWRVWHATNVSLIGDVPSFYGPPFADALSQNPSSAFVADGSPVIVRRGARISG